MGETENRRIAAAYRRGRPLRFRFNGTEIEAFEGESIAAALIASGVYATRRSPTGHLRGPFCFMGSCRECAVRIDGRKILACATPAADGLDVRSDGVGP
jgi:sarcosine oxidase subunit alpha